MGLREDIAWFKSSFHQSMTRAVRGTPFSLDLLTAIALQETGPTWRAMKRAGLSTPKILRLCVGDTLDAPNRRAFPKNKAALVEVQQGQQMFTMAHDLLVEMAQYVPGYEAVARRSHKFCRGYGVFQLDLQFFKQDPDYFLQKHWADFDACVDRCVKELFAAMRRMGWQDRTELSDLEQVHVGIAYNQGRFNPSRGLRQGYRNGAGVYYGEALYDYLQKAKSVPTPNAAPPVTVPGPADVAPPEPVRLTGKAFRVEPDDGTLLEVRSEPRVDQKQPGRNVIGQLPSGHLVKGKTATVRGYREIETSINGALLSGFALASALKSTRAATIPIATPIEQPPVGAPPAVHMPNPRNHPIKRTNQSRAHRLNEAGQPDRAGESPDELRASLIRIVDWLGVDKPSHKRYQPGNGLTYCNIYAYDYCCLAGVYLPRVWWTGASLVAIGQGQSVRPVYAETIEEMRANALFAWLRDFGMSFGWRRAASVDELQRETNSGGVGVIVARRRTDGPPGHISVVAPETDRRQAVREHGLVVSPVQSQAGARNIRLGLNREWWIGEQFAEHAFWIHG